MRKTECFLSDVRTSSISDETHCTQHDSVGQDAGSNLELFCRIDLPQETAVAVNLVNIFVKPAGKEATTAIFGLIVDTVLSAEYPRN